MFQILIGFGCAGLVIWIIGFIIVTAWGRIR